MGTFQTGMYVDNEAWVALEDAQTLLGYGKDVSIFIIPDEGILSSGDTLPGGVSIVNVVWVLKPKACRLSRSSGSLS